MRHRQTDENYGLKDLCRDAQVTERTVRYYIQEGLLPPPEGAGPLARYSREHLLRLRLIRRLKEEYYLPLAEIRRRLETLGTQDLEALDQQAIVDEEYDEAPVEEAEANTTETDAKTYLDRLLNWKNFPANSLSVTAPQRPEPSVWPPASSSPASKSPDQNTARDNYALHLQTISQKSEGETWQRVTIVPGVELHYQPQDEEQRKRIDRLLAEARQIFNP